MPGSPQAKLCVFKPRTTCCLSVFLVVQGTNKSAAAYVHMARVRIGVANDNMRSSMFEVTGIPGRLDDKPLARATMNRSQLAVYYGAYMVHEASGTLPNEHSADATNLTANATCFSQAVPYACCGVMAPSHSCVAALHCASPRAPLASYFCQTAMPPSVTPVAGMILLPYRDRVLIQGISLEGILVGKSRLGPRCGSRLVHTE